MTLISLTSLAGVATIPFIGKKLYKKVLDMLVGLAVGSLAADSLLHLLPHVSTLIIFLNKRTVLYFALQNRIMWTRENLNIL